MKKPRILQIANHYVDRGGEESAVERFSEHVRPVASMENCFFRSSEWRGKTAPSRLNQARWMWRNPGALRQIQEVDRACGAEVWLVNNVFPVASAGVYALARSLDRPVIQYLHNFRPLSINGYYWANGQVSAGRTGMPYVREIMGAGWQGSRLKTVWFGLVLARLRRSGFFQSVRAWIAVSDFVRERFVEAGVPAERIFTIPYGWEVRNSVLDEPGDEGYYLFLGRLVEQKGIRTLFNAWEELQNERGSDAPKLRICGEGPLANWVREKCSMSSGISYCGQVAGQEKHRLIQGARALIAPSIWWEPLGLVTYEAYDYGKPMLAARSGGLAETVVDGKTGFLHAPGDSRELASHVACIEEDVDLRDSMGRAGREWLLQNASPEEWRRKFSRVLRFVRSE